MAFGKSKKTNETQKPRNSANPWSTPRPTGQSAAEARKGLTARAQLPSEVTTPQNTRITVSVLIGVGVGAMGLPIHPGVRVALLAIFVFAGCLIAARAPYKTVWKEVMLDAYGHQKTPFGQVATLFPAWMIMMILPVIPAYGALTALGGFLLTTIYMYLVFKWFDGTSMTTKARLDLQKQINQGKKIF